MSTPPSFPTLCIPLPLGKFHITKNVVCVPHNLPPPYHFQGNFQWISHQVLHIFSVDLLCQFHKMLNNLTIVPKRTILGMISLCSLFLLLLPQDNYLLQEDTLMIGRKSMKKIWTNYLLILFCFPSPHVTEQKLQGLQFVHSGHRTSLLQDSNSWIGP